MDSSANDPGVPSGSRPANERDEDQIRSDVHVPGPYPTAEGDPTGEPLTSEAEPSKESRDTGSLGDVVEGTGVPPMARVASEAAGGGTPHTKVPDSPREAAQQLRDESYPDGAPEDADVGTGRQKGQGLPPGSTGKGDDTPQTPAT